MISGISIASALILTLIQLILLPQLIFGIIAPAEPLSADCIIYMVEWALSIVTTVLMLIANMIINKSLKTSPLKSDFAKQHELEANKSKLDAGGNREFWFGFSLITITFIIVVLILIIIPLGIFFGSLDNPPRS